MSEVVSHSLDVTIMGRSYRVNCAEGERDALLRAVAYLDEKMTEIRDSGRVGGLDRIAVMAALNIAHEFLSSKLGNDVDVGDLRGRITRMQALLEEAIAPQQPLF